jgi:hypothetical protein
MPRLGSGYAAELQRSAAKRRMIEYIGNVILYEFAFLLMFSPFTVLVMSLPDPKHPGIYKILYFTLVLLMLMLYLSTGWLAHKAATRRVHYNQTFHRSLMGAFIDARMFLSFLPIIGSLFVAKDEPPKGDIQNTPIE